MVLDADRGQGPADLHQAARPQLGDIGGWPAVLGRVAAGDDLTSTEAGAALREILEGAATASQMAAFIFGLRCKGETAEELSGMLEAMLEVAETVPVPKELADRLVDTCGTGGDRAGTINVSTIAALVVAGAGVPVCKHGGRAASSRTGSADVLEALGVEIALPPVAVARCIEQAGIGFCFAPRYHPAMRHVGPTRRELGVPTAFNLLGPWPTRDAPVTSWWAWATVGSRNAWPRCWERPAPGELGSCMAKMDWTSCPPPALRRWSSGGATVLRGRCTTSWSNPRPLAWPWPGRRNSKGGTRRSMPGSSTTSSLAKRAHRDIALLNGRPSWSW